MPRKSVHAEDIVYFPERILSKVSRVRDYPLTLIEAPSGFGKTTSFREYLRAHIPSSSRAFWYTSLGEPSTKAWGTICDLFDDVDPRVSRNLRSLDTPNRETMADVAAIMRECSCDRDSFLIIDNYQLVKSEVQSDIINAFSLHRNNTLHIVFITQKLSENTTWRAPDIHNIGPVDFSFDKRSVQRYFALAGLTLSSQELETVCAATGGWIAALKLQMLHYKATGGLAPANTMNDLIETSIWNRLSEEEKRFLLSVSLFECFSPRQASIMLEGVSNDVNIDEILRRNAFVPFVPNEGVYYMHSLLQNYLKSRFEETGEAFRRETYRRAGRACETVGEYFHATQFHIETGNYEAILSMPFTTQYFYNFRERSVIDLFERLVDECPEETLLKYPLALVTFGQQFFRDRRMLPFSKTTALVQKLLDAPSGLSGTELLRIRGEFSILMSFPQFNDIAKMSEYHRRAYDSLRHLSDPPRSVIFGGAMPWTMSGASVLFLYWRESGALKKTLSVMDECLPYYVALAGGHGAGGEYVLRAEAALFRGDDVEAEVMCHTALFEARSAGQIGNCLCASLVLARIMLLRGDGDSYTSIRRSILKDAQEAQQTSLLRIGDLCQAVTDLALGRLDDLPPWLRDAESIRKVVYTDGQPYAMMLHGMALLQEERFSELYGIAEPVMEFARRMHYMLPQVYYNIYLAVAKNAEGCRDEAVRHLEQALFLALPDEVYLPFAEHGDSLTPLFDSLQSAFPEDRVRALRSLCARQASGAEAVRKALSGSGCILSARQREVALLLKNGLSVKEISEKLFVTENTVKSITKAVYGKLGVHSRVELTKASF